MHPALLLISFISISQIQTAIAYSIVACERDALTIKCAAGQVISITNALYGRTYPHICNYGQDISENNCQAPNALEVVSSRCNKLQECTVSADNNIFGDPCPYILKYLLVEYQCLEPKISFILACEHDKMDIKCNDGKFIKIRNAIYGRTNPKICGSGKELKNVCQAPNSLSIVKSRCDKQKECTVPAEDDVFGDPCPSLPKYLQVEYQCEEPTINSVLACEDSNVNINCASGLKIKITNVLYGRTDPRICNSGQYSPHTSCRTSNALDIVATRCNNLESCSIAASNSVFGDPCAYVLKYLQVQYQCL